MPVAMTSACLPYTPMDLPPAPPTPESLTYSLTLPAAPQSPAIVRAVIRTVLDAHDLADMADAVVQVASELVACACRFTTSPEVYVCLRYREEALRVVLYDAHPATSTLASPPPATPAAARRCACRPVWSGRAAVTGASVAPASPAAARGRGRSCQGRVPAHS
ncbi:ATP-binding protein [Streptomyces sp. NPDC087317]|uniref:ATP-binding protein n=1 Tax=Streptomyces sp. NPDC087317 TaxID=3365784 RepID=UPI0037F1956E